ncbi:MAG: hypothetical protein WBE91_09165 [Steroidobacteraceae bacterium]
MNLAQLAYFSQEQPFLNIFKQAGSNTIFTGWFTQAGSNFDTSEEAYLQLDSDGYPTSLTAKSTPPGGQKFNSVATLINYQLGTPPGASVPYPGGSYTLQFQGQGTIVLGLDVTSGSLATSSANCTASGLTITSAMATGQTCTVTFSVTPQSGIQFAITALPSSSNYIRDVSIVQTQYESNYQAGEMFNPAFIAALNNSGTGGFKVLRFMWWLDAVNQEWPVAFTANLPSGATSGTLSNLTPEAGYYTSWPLPTGTYTFVFATGQTIQVHCTYGSASVTWSTPLSAAIPTGAAGSMATFLEQGSWSNRPLLSNAFWTLTQGVPYEAAIQLCNEVNTGCWLSIPAGVEYTTNYAYTTSLAQLLYNGTGADLTGSTLTSFSGLNSGLKAYIENSNETWNGMYGGYYFGMMLGALQFQNAYGGNTWYEQQEWLGTEQANITDAFYAVYGSDEFSQRVVTVMCNQIGDPGLMEEEMNTPDWTSRAYTHHIGGTCYAPYFGTYDVSAADASAIVASANPLDTYFGLAYSNTYNGVTYSSIPSNGYLGGAISQENTSVQSVSTQPWASLPVFGYEGGSASNTNGMPAQNVAGWLSLIQEAHRDPRFGYLYYDPTHQLSSNPGYLPASAAAGFAFINQFNDISGIDQYGEWGALENVTQSIDPLSGAPPKYRAIMDYIDQ